MADNILNQYISGVHNLIDNENIPKDAAQDSINWLTQDGVIKLINGKVTVGTEGTEGSCQGEHFGYKNDGTTVHYRKINTKIQYLNGTTWTDVVTGLTNGYQYVFTNYSSLAGNFTIAWGLDGIYKMHNANPGSYSSMYSSTVNDKFAGAIIDKGRAFAWGKIKDKTGIYLSKIDVQTVGTNYTAVSGEATTSLTGTLAFKGGGATRNCFGVTITITAGGQVFTDNYDGTLTGSAGGTGTINYTTGAYTLSASGVGTAAYTYEDSNSGGVTDFRFSSPRVAGEGDILRQDEGGDAILTVKVGLDNAYYSLKSQSVYRLELSADDLSATNEVFRREIGIQYFRAATNTQQGIVFMNTSNQERPELTILQQNPLGGNVEPTILFPHFNFSNYTYSKAVLGTYGQFIVMSCMTPESTVNDITLLMDKAKNTVDITSYGSTTLAKDATNLYGGSPYTETVYQLFTGVDDDNGIIENFWIGKGETYDTEVLKKYRRLRFKGNIDPAQYCEIYISYDDDGYQLVGTIRGDGTYVDYSNPQTIGSNMVGEMTIGGGTDITVYPFFMELKVKVPKFRKRTIKYVTKTYGYFSIDTQMDRDVLLFEARIPKKYRLKQNVNLAGTETDQPNPEF